jgi:hypothetical protein
MFLEFCWAQSHGERVDARVIAAVEEELKGLSAALPQLPWSVGKGAGRR